MSSKKGQQVPAAPYQEEPDKDVDMDSDQELY